MRQPLILLISYSSSHPFRQLLYAHQLLYCAVHPAFPRFLFPVLRTGLRMRKNQYPAVYPADRPRGGKPVHPRHGHVHAHHVKRPALSKQAYGLLSVLRFHDLRAMTGKQLADHPPHQRIVLRNQKAPPRKRRHVSALKALIARVTAS